MPNTKSAKKRLRQNVTRRDRNRSAKRALRNRIRKVREAVEGGSVEEAETQFKLAVKSLDRAGSANLIHPNAAARTKSRLSARVKAMKQAN
ncbi:MAG: 30S ribosomal protein S20 [Planctomycetia bacterium]|jgi:small subunit ribosomal protein S20